MKRQKIYSTEASLLKAINEAHTKIADLEAEASKFDAVGMELEAKKLRAQLWRVETVRLPKLKDALAEFRTQPFQFMEGYQGVVLH